MISRSVNCAHRIALSLAYPIILRLEKALGLLSNVAVVAVWHDDKLLVIKHSYKQGDALPGGTIGLGETPVEAAARELYEEVGISARPDELTPRRLWRHQKGNTWLFEYRPSSLPLVVPDQREVVAAQFVRRNQLPASISAFLGMGFGEPGR